MLRSTIRITTTTTLIVLMYVYINVYLELRIIKQISQMKQLVKDQIGHLLKKKSNNDYRAECILFNNNFKLHSHQEQIDKRQYYFYSEAELIGIKRMDRETDDIFSTLSPTRDVMQKYYQKRKEAKRTFRHLPSTLKLTLGVDRNYIFHLEKESSKNMPGLQQELTFKIQHISAYGSHFDYWNIFSIIVVEEILNYTPTCLVFKFRSPIERHRTAEAFIETLNCISTDLSGVFSFDSSTNYLATIHNS